MGKAATNLQRVYVEQFDNWWSFTYQQWRDYLRHQLAQEKLAGGWCGFTLPDNRELSNRPRHVARIPDVRCPYGYSKEYMTKSPYYLVRQPNDWSLEDFRLDLELIEAREAELAEVERVLS